MDNSPPWIPDMNITASVEDATVAETVTDCQTPVECPAMDRNTPTIKTTVHRRGGTGTMGNELRAAARLSTFGDGKKFIPLDKFRQIVSPESVQRELDSGRDTEANSFKTVQDIFANPGYTKIFAILSLINQVQDIAVFLQAELTDDDLPFHRTFGQSSGRTALFPDLLVRGWPEPILQAFEKYQWMLLAPVFDLSPHKLSHYKIDDDACLPFMLDANDRNSAPREGGFSEVWKVIIDRSHVKSYNRDEVAQAQGVNTYAIKRLHPEASADSFIAERKVFEWLSGSSTQHLIRLLATYEHKGRYHFILPWANGTLFDMWENTSPPPTITASSALWFADQVQGLVEGLLAIHRPRTVHDKMEKGEFYGRHGDITPTNILWLKDRHDDAFGTHGGRLVISDFGLTEFYQKDTMRGTKAQTVAYTATYRPPECDIGDQPATGSYDIWVLGCVLLEFVTWYVGGWDSLLEFENLRVQNDTDVEGLKEDKFFVTVQGKSIRTARVKQDIIEWSDRIRDHTRCTRYMDDMISMIMSGMLQVDPRDRITTEDLLRDVREMREKCNHDALYFSQAGLPPDDPTLTDSVTAYTCPFRKRNPLKFSVTDHTTCALSSYPDIPQVKKHVLSAHMRPNDADPHTADEFELGVSAEACDKLRNRKTGHQILEWNTLWAVLFPNDTVIPTGEYEPVIEDHEVHRKFLKGSGLFRALFRTIESTRENTARSDIGSGPIADDWHIARAVISQQLGFRTLTGSSSQ
ncbi:kinase-like domain-containing protein, partial [Rhypophila decipiens]